MKKLITAIMIGTTIAMLNAGVYAASFENIGDIDGGGFNSRAASVSDDGSVVAGLGFESPRGLVGALYHPAGADAPAVILPAF